MGRRHIRSVYLRTPKTPRPIASREGQKDALALFSQPRNNDAVRRSLDNTLSPEGSREIRPNPQPSIDGGHFPGKVSAGVESPATAPIKSEIAAEPQLSTNPPPLGEAANGVKAHDGADVETLAGWMMGAESDAFLSQQAAREAWQPGTDDWFFESSEFHRWENAASSFMWISGNPGSGKSTLCSAVIETLKARHGLQNPAGLAYYYCRDEDQKIHEDDLIIRLIIGQLSLQRQAPFACLQRLYERSTKFQSHPSRTELVSVLQDILSSFETTYIIIDGLDQHPGRANFFDALREIWTGGVRLRVMILSRRDSATEDYLTSTPVEKEHFTIRKHHVNFVAETLVRRQIRESPLMRGFRDFEDKWTQTLVEKSHGMYVTSLSPLTDQANFSTAGYHGSLCRSDDCKLAVPLSLSEKSYRHLRHRSTIFLQTWFRLSQMASNLETLFPICWKSCRSRHRPCQSRNWRNLLLFT